VGRSSLVGLALAVVAATLVSAAFGSRLVARDDPATLAFYKEVQASYRTVPAVLVHRHGFLWYTDTAPGSAFRWVSSKRPPPGGGYKPASESILVLLTNGRVTKYVDTAKAAGMPTLTIIEDSTGLWASLSKKPACYHRSSRAGDVAGWGSQFVGVYGTFSPMETHGDTVIIRSTYPWLRTEQAVEVDRISATTKHLQSYTVTVTGTSPITFSAANQNIAKPANVPAPKPHC
jgi:hypothetical protein